MSGRWSLQAPPANQHKPTPINRCIIGYGQQSVFLQVPRRSWAVHGSCSSGVPGDHHTSNGTTRRSCASSAPAAQAALVASGTAPLLVHVTDSLALRSISGTANIASHCHSREQQECPRQQQDVQQQQQLLLQPYVVMPTGGQEGSNAGSAAAQHSSSSTNVTADSSPSHVQVMPAADAAEPLKYHITRCIKRCRCWQEVDVVVREYGPAFNIIHISAAITHLAQLSTGKQQQQQQQQRLQQASQPGQVEQQLKGDMQLVQGITLITWQMDRQHKQLQLSLLQHKQQQQQAGCQQQQQMQLVQQLLDQAVLRLPEAGSRQVANMLWALAQLQYPWRGSTAATAAVAALTEAAAPLFSRADAQHLSNMAYAAARLQLLVDKSWLTSLQAAWLQLVLQAQEQQEGSAVGSRQQSDSSSSSSHSSQHISSNRSQYSSSRTRQSEAATPHACISPQAAANMMWALVHLQQQPPCTDWLQQVVAAMVGSLLEWPARSVAVFMWGCARLGYQLGASAAAQSPTWAVEQRSQSAGASIQQVELQRAAQQLRWQADSGCLHQHHQQGQDVPAMLLQALQLHSQDFSCRDVSQVLWAAAVMRLQLPAPLLRQLLASSSAQLPVLQGQLQAAQANSCSSGNCRPHTSSSASGGAAVAHSVSLVLYSLARMGVMPQQQLPPLLLRPWFSALLASSSSADSHCLASAAWAICKLGLAGSCPLVVKAMLEAAQSHLQRSSSSNLQELEAKPLPVTALQSGVHAADMSSRAVASLMRAAAYCTLPSAAAAPAVQQCATAYAASAPQSRTNAANRQQHVASASHREYLRQRQQQQLRLMLQGMQSAGPQQAAPGREVSSGPGQARVQRMTGQGGSAVGRKPSAAQAIQAAALQLLLSAAGIPSTQPGGTNEQQQQQQQQHVQLVQADVHHQLGQQSFPRQQPPPGSSAPQGQQQQQLVLGALPGASMMDLSQVLWAASGMNLQLPKLWWQRCILQLQQLLGQHQQQAAQSLVLSVWALGKARVLVPSQLMQALQHASLPLLQPSQHGAHHQQQLHTFTPQGYAMLLVGLVRLCMVAGHQLRPARQPKQQWQVRAAKRRGKQLNHVQLSRRAHTKTIKCARACSTNGSKAQVRQQATVQELHIMQQQQQACPDSSNKLSRGERTARRLQQRRRRFRRYLQLHQHYWVHAAGLNPDWLQAYCMSAAQQLSSFTPTGLTALLWGLGKLRYHPGSSFLATALQCVEQHLPHMSARHIALLLWSLQRLQHMPGDDELLSAVMQAWEHRLASASKADSQQVQWVQGLQQIRQMQSKQQLGVL